MSPKVKYILLGGLILGVFWSLLINFNKNDSLSNNLTQLDDLTVQEIKNELLLEFNESYTEDITPNGIVKEFDLVAAETELTLPSGKQETLFSYNGQTPGPTFKITLGDTIKVNFKNELPQDTTVHFHGVRVPNAMDGVPNVTQEPVKPGEEFIYEFTPKDAGTFWFHPHVRTSEQLEKGLYGVLIVEEIDPDPYTQDVIWVLDDWRLDKTGGLNKNFNTGHDLMHDGRWGQYITVNGKNLETLEVKNGERIRLRLINASNGRIYSPNFFNLDATVIAVDGMRVSSPFKYSNFDLSPGNRIDLDIIINTVKESQITVLDTFTRNPNTLATIKISDETIGTPLFEVAKSYVPSWSNSTILPADYEFRLNARRGGPYGIEWTINEKTLSQVEPVSLQQGEFQKIKFTNQSSRLHPMHLHGQFFKVLSIDGVQPLHDYWQDTVLVGPKQTVEVGIVPLDKGSWVNHCHILEHAEAGMVTVVEVL